MLSPILVCISFFTHVFDTPYIFKKPAKNIGAYTRKKVRKNSYSPFLFRDGVLLCHVANAIDPAAVDMKKVNQRPQMAQFLCLKNIRRVDCIMIIRLGISVVRVSGFQCKVTQCTEV